MHRMQRLLIPFRHGRWAVAVWLQGASSPLSSQPVFGGSWSTPLRILPPAPAVRGVASTQTTKPPTDAHSTEHELDTAKKPASRGLRIGAHRIAIPKIPLPPQSDTTLPGDCTPRPC